ncbi:NYN domain-containing protein [Patescibacteria group bacterium]|nr:NYN domain-containing protein [Patescibacteria group bacterium]MBU4056933.1 NYN domain-containing protein [Patescibacteria group bacterium]MBU4368796.1 NYN domain-containing protein [Patescibacteria group bacterium]
MNLSEFKLQSLGIDKEKFGKIYTFVDFGNVDYWFEYDTRDFDDNDLPAGQKLIVDLEKLSNFLKLFSDHKRFYFGLDLKNRKSFHLSIKAKSLFDKANTKPIQRIKHYLKDLELKSNTRSICEDVRGKYIYIPKCNFDVEICIDAIRSLEKYDTFCLLSSDADFAALAEFLKRRGKKFILISAGYVSHWLKDKADLNINAQRIKREIAVIKQKPRL